MPCTPLQSIAMCHVPCAMPFARAENGEQPHAAYSSSNHISLGRLVFRVVVETVVIPPLCEGYNL